MSDTTHEKPSGLLRFVKRGRMPEKNILQQEWIVYDVTQPYLVEIGREWRDVPIEVEA
ncbi:MAG: hypothetical protein KF802_16330 [Bdellovibrionaceae bacterium]|nr:hypothetical protein [Pseudobdellovibrionaceae bacterium]